MGAPPPPLLPAQPAVGCHRGLHRGCGDARTPLASPAITPTNRETEWHTNVRDWVLNVTWRDSGAPLQTVSSPQPSRRPYCVPLSRREPCHSRVPGTGVALHHQIGCRSRHVQIEGRSRHVSVAPTSQCKRPSSGVFSPSVPSAFTLTNYNIYDLAIYARAPSRSHATRVARDLAIVAPRLNE